MTRVDEERIDIFRRIANKKGLDDIAKMKDEKLLEILNAAIIPNSISPHNLKYSYFSFFALHGSKSDRNRMDKSLKYIRSATDVMRKKEREMYFFSIYNGLSGQVGEDYKRFIEEPKKWGRGIRRLTIEAFLEAYWFFKKIVEKGENGERFPKL